MEQHLELENLGILRQTKAPAELAWMTDIEKSFLLDLLVAGETGLHKRTIQKFENKNSDAFFNLQVRNLVEWESDKSGKPMFLVLSWQGKDIAELLLQVAKHESKRKVRS